MKRRPSAPTVSFEAEPDPVVRPPELGVARSPMFGLETLKGVLARIARGTDDPTSAMSLLLVLRTFATESKSDVLIELKALEAGMLATFEDATHDVWLLEMLPVSLRTVRAVIDEMPELVYGLQRSEREDALTLRTTRSRYDTLSSRMTPLALPSLNLLLEAGLLTQRGTGGGAT